MQALGSSSGLL